MIAILIRIVLGATLFLSGEALIDWFFDTDVLGAAGRLLLWFWRAIVEFFARFAGVFSRSLAVSIRTLAQRTVLRRISRPLWRMATVIIMITLLNQIRQEQIERWFTTKQLQAINAFKQVLNFKPDWPRSIRASIAAVVVSGFIWLFFWIDYNVGRWWGLGASVILWEAATKVQVIGLDALTSWITEKWVPVKKFIGRHIWVRWFWLGPVFSWIAQSTESFQETQRRRTNGKSYLQVWREKRRATKVAKQVKPA